MHLVTQISGYHPNEIVEFTAKLKELGTEVRTTLLDDAHDCWQRYEAAVEQFHNIATCSFHTILNVDSMIDKEMSLHILYAMLAGTPVMFHDLPTFTDDVDTYTQRLIASRLHSFHVTNLLKNGLPELNSAIRHLADISVDYALNAHDEVLVRSKVRNYLRELVAPEQQTHVVEKSTPRKAALSPSFA